MAQQKKKGKKKGRAPKQTELTNKKRPVKSFLDEMIEDREYASIIDCIPQNLNLLDECRKGISQVEEVRKRPLVCYFSNVVKPGIQASIEYSDDLPFSEMINSVDGKNTSIDIVFVTNGGIAEQVAKFVNKLRPRFQSVTMIIPDIAMSAGTLFALAGDEIIMDSRAHIGPIDPQIPNREGRYVPAQSLLTAISEIQERGEELLKKGQNPLWSDIQILNKIDPKDIGIALNSSGFSIDLAKEYLRKYKFMNWDKHSDGRNVTEEDKENRALEIANLLCKHDEWKTHSRGITRNIAWDVCKIKIANLEDTPGLEFAIRRLWTLLYWFFENTNLSKVFVSDNYSLFRSAKTKE